MSRVCIRWEKLVRKIKWLCGAYNALQSYMCKVIKDTFLLIFQHFCIFLTVDKFKIFAYTNIKKSVRISIVWIVSEGNGTLISNIAHLFGLTL